MNYCKVELKMARDADELIPEDCKLRFALVDECFEEFVNGFTWYLTVENSVYAITTTGGRRYFMHGMIKPSPRRFEVDHAGFNALDNRWSALRWATRWQNAVNRRGCERGSSAYKGVRYTKNKWVGSITLKHAPERTTDAQGKINCTHSSERYCATWYELLARQAYGEWHAGSFSDVSDAALLGAAIAEGVELVDAINPGETLKGKGRRRIYNTLSPEAWMQRVAEKRKADKAEMAEREQAAFNYAKIHGRPGHPVREGKVT